MASPFREHVKSRQYRHTLAQFKSRLDSLLHFVSAFNPMADSNSNSSADAPPFDPSVPSIPISYPLKTLEELQSRSYFDSFHFPFNKASVKLPAASAGPLPDRPRILVCHDMEGGYVDDKWIQGGSNPDAYAIWHWYLMDVFVYFSHNLVTLPPPCWTNTAHKHGVKVLGTFIMEWDEGVILADKLLSTKDSAFMYAERLTELAVALGFDGWLINMEVKLDVGQIPNLIEFVNHLTKTMHSSVPESLVIWYDSVTTDGSLLWQDQLNEKNKPFFDVCDGIFVNYTWKESYPLESAAVAGERKYDVYMGIDVFGRNTYGGGQWTVGLYTNYSGHILLLYCLSIVSCKFTTLLRSELNEHKALLTPARFVQTNAALDVIKKDNVSAAIFAPGWVYETKQPPDFQTAQNRWWGLVEKSWGISQKYPQVLPFYSNFDQGHGYHVFIDGVQILDAPWNNISLQSFQPFLVSGEPTTGTIEVFVDFKEGSYSGGGNITFRGTLDKSAHFRTRLFEGKLLLGESPLNFTYSVKSSRSSLIGLSLLFSSASNEKKSVLLASSGDPLHTYDHLASHFDSVIMPHQVTEHGAKPGWVVQESSIVMDGYTLTEIGATCYKLKTEPTEPEQTTSSSGSSDYHSVLGHIAVRTPETNPILPSANSWLIDSRYVAWSSGSRKLSMMLTWQLKNGNADLSMQYNIHVQRVTKSSNEELNNGDRGAQFLGAAMVEAFYISDLEIPDGTSTLKFIIQVTIDGISQKLEDSPSYQLNVQDS